MFSKLFWPRPRDQASPLNSTGAKPRASDATMAWSEWTTPDEKDIARATIFAYIFLAEKEQDHLKKGGNVPKVIRRKKGRYFHTEKPPVDSRGKSFDSMIDDKGHDWSFAIDWDEGLQSDPLWMDEDERRSVSPPDWAISTAIEAAEGAYKPTIYDWFESFDGTFDPPVINEGHSVRDIEEPSTPGDEFVSWCESLTNSAFALTRKEMGQETDDDLDDGYESDFDNDTVCDELDNEYEDGLAPDYFAQDETPHTQITDDGLLVRGEVIPGTATLHRGFEVHQAPAVIECDCAVIRHRRGGVVSHCQIV